MRIGAEWENSAFKLMNYATRLTLPFEKILVCGRSSGGSNLKEEKKSNESNHALIIYTFERDKENAENIIFLLTSWVLGLGAYSGSFKSAHYFFSLSVTYATSAKRGKIIMLFISLVMQLLLFT